jgi:hypothetical protein
MAPRAFTRFGLTILGLFVSATMAYSATYYVRTDGIDSNDGLTNAAEGAWRTIDWAADHAAPGDIVRVYPGTYSERVTPSVSGTSGQPITILADGAAVFCGMDISSKSYLRIIGFTIDTDAGCARSSRAVNVMGTNTGLEFWNNIIRDANYTGIGSGSYADRHHNFVVIGNIFTALGAGGAAVSLRGNNNLLAYNEVDRPNPDAFIVDGNYSYFLNNYSHDPSDGGGHSDVFQSNSSSLGLSYNLFEGNFIVGAGNLADEHGALLQNQSTSSCSTGACGSVMENLFRRNVWHNLSGSALSADTSTVGPIKNTRQVHDTLASVMRTNSAAGYGVLFRASGNTAYLFNNLNYQAWGDSRTTNVQVFFADTGASIAGADHNLAFTPRAALTYVAPWTAQTNDQSNVEPAFVDYANDNFTLDSSSGARGTAGALTTVRGSGTGSTFTVAAGGGGFFRGPNASIHQYAGRLTTGDVITVGATTRTVASVVGDAISVTAPFNWADGAPVYLGPGATPDIGAYPYTPGGHSLVATYAISSGSVTVTPSDASLVRFVVCYEEGIPTTVDNSAPFSCAVGAGALDVRVYPRYASKTLFVRASEGSSAPSNLRIVAD